MELLHTTSFMNARATPVTLLTVITGLAIPRLVIFIVASTYRVTPGSRALPSDARSHSVV